MQAYSNPKRATTPNQTIAPIGEWERYLEHSEAIRLLHNAHTYLAYCSNPNECTLPAMKVLSSAMGDVLKAYCVK